MFYLFICVFIDSAAPCLGNYCMITLLARGERHASVRPTVLSCRHSREVTRRDSSWLTGIKATQRYLTDPPPAISFTKAGHVVILERCFLLFFSSIMGPWRRLGPRCSCNSCTTDAYATANQLTPANPVSERRLLIPGATVLVRAAVIHLCTVSPVFKPTAAPCPAEPHWPWCLLLSLWSRQTPIGL